MSESRAAIRNALKDHTGEAVLKSNGAIVIPIEDQNAALQAIMQMDTSLLTSYPHDKFIFGDIRNERTMLPFLLFYAFFTSDLIAETNSQMFDAWLKDLTEASLIDFYIRACVDFIFEDKSIECRISVFFSDAQTLAFCKVFPLDALCNHDMVTITRRLSKDPTCCNDLTMLNVIECQGIDALDVPFACSHDDKLWTQVVTKAVKRLFVEQEDRARMYFLLMSERYTWNPISTIPNRQDVIRDLVPDYDVLSYIKAATDVTDLDEEITELFGEMSALVTDLYAMADDCVPIILYETHLKFIQEVASYRLISGRFRPYFDKFLEDIQYVLIATGDAKQAESVKYIIDTETMGIEYIMDQFKNSFESMKDGGQIIPTLLEVAANIGFTELVPILTAYGSFDSAWTADH